MRVTESLDELTDMVAPLFGDVENKNLSVPEWLQHPYGPDQLKVRALGCVVVSRGVTWGASCSVT